MDICAKDIAGIVSKGMALKPANVWPMYGKDASLDRSAYVTSSEISYCERKVYFDKEELKASDYSPEKGTAQITKGWGMMERGHVIEEWFIKTLYRGLDSRVPLILAGDDQRSFAVGHQSGTPDGVFLLPDNCFKTLEVKSIDPRTNVSKLPKPEHIKQVTQNCDLCEALLGRVCLGAVLVYIDASDYDRRFSFDIPFDHALADTLQHRATRILQAKSAADLLPEGVYASHCGFCRHTAACNALVRKPMKEGTQNDINAAATKLFGKL